MTLPIGPNDRLVEFAPAREAAGLPPIYQTPSHPKKTGPGSIYYYIQELSKPALTKAMVVENKLRIPHGPETVAIERGEPSWDQEISEPINLHSIGFLKLEEDDIVFVRASTAPASGEDDVAVCWVTGGYVGLARLLTTGPLTSPNSRILTREDKSSVIDARDLCLGNKEDRTPDRAVKLDKETWSGGVAFERNRRAKPVKPNTRCYSLGNSFETQTKIMAPCANNKITGARDEEAVKMRQQLLKVCIIFLIRPRRASLSTGICADCTESARRRPS